MEERDARYLATLMESSSDVTEAMLSIQDVVYNDRHDEYRMWFRTLNPNMVANMMVLCAVSILGKNMIFRPFVNEFNVDDSVMQNLVALCYRYDVGPYRSPNPDLGPYVTDDAINVIGVLERVRQGSLVSARNLMTPLEKGTARGSLAQTMYLMHTIAMVVGHQPVEGVPAGMAEMRATSLRTLGIGVREHLKLTPWCAECTPYAHEILRSTEDRKDTGEEEATPDSKWIESMKKEWDK